MSEAKVATEERRLYDQALVGLPGLTAREAVLSIQEQSIYIQQVYVIAEEDGAARDYVLGMFPKPLDSMREFIHGN
jgi:hypothetical protein